MPPGHDHSLPQQPVSGHRGSRTMAPWSVVARNPGIAPGGRRRIKSADRPAAVRVTAHGINPYRAYPRQDGLLLASPTGGNGDVRGTAARRDAIAKSHWPEIRQWLVGRDIDCKAPSVGAFAT